MRNLFVAFLASMTLFDTSCARHVSGTPDQNVIDAFGIVVKDVQVNTNSSGELKPQLTKDENGQVTFQSSDWLDASRRLFESADSLGATSLYQGRLKLIKLGREISQLFYSYSNTATPMMPTLSPPGNPYLEEAYFYVKDILNKQYQTTMTNAAAHVATAASQVKVKAGPKRHRHEPGF